MAQRQHAAADALSLLTLPGHGASAAHKAVRAHAGAGQPPAGAAVPEHAAKLETPAIPQKHPGKSSCGGDAYVQLTSGPPLMHLGMQPV